MTQVSTGCLHLVTCMLDNDTRTQSVWSAEILLGILAQRGFTRAKDPAGANVILLNTCAIREKAEQKILCRLGELKALKARKHNR